jgi:hypothetical protein
MVMRRLRRPDGRPADHEATGFFVIKLGNIKGLLRLNKIIASYSSYF